MLNKHSLIDESISVFFAPQLLVPVTNGWRLATVDFSNIETCAKRMGRTPYLGRVTTTSSKIRYERKCTTIYIIISDK